MRSLFAKTSTPTSSSPALKVLKALSALLVLKALSVLLVRWVLPVLLELLDRREALVRQEQLAQQVRRAK